MPTPFDRKAAIAEIIGRFDAVMRLATDADQLLWPKKRAEIVLSLRAMTDWNLWITLSVNRQAAGVGEGSDA